MKPFGSEPAAIYPIVTPAANAYDATGFDGDVQATAVGA
jgi:hypothetical protein